ncbi:MAG: DUF2510 domain-containing protein [Mycobacterium sp.]|nr:DUF2510 domain-containing protein [Mycobacterium sp.]
MLYQHVRRPFWRRHPAVTVTVVAMTSWWLWHGWYEALAVTAAVALLVGFSRHRRAAAVRDAGLAARAEYEHRLSLAGDPRGTFGRYPPVQPGWYPDPDPQRHPQHRCQLRYFDGAVWTAYVARR